MPYSVFPLPFTGLARNFVDRGNEGRILKRWPVLYRGGLYKTEHYWFSQKDLYTQKAHSEVCKIPKLGVCRDTAIRTLQNLIKTSVWRSIYSTIWMVVSRLNFKLFLNWLSIVESSILKKKSFLSNWHIKYQNNYLRVVGSKQLTIIGRGRAKYRDLSVASISVICRSRRPRQILDLRDSDKSRYFAITEFNSCFIGRSPSLFLNEFLREAESPLPYRSNDRDQIILFWFQ